jgi:hypothetical protein
MNNEVMSYDVRSAQSGIYGHNHLPPDLILANGLKSNGPNAFFPLATRQPTNGHGPVWLKPYFYFSSCPSTRKRTTKAHSSTPNPSRGSARRETGNAITGVVVPWSWSADAVRQIERQPYDYYDFVVIKVVPELASS